MEEDNIIDAMGGLAIIYNGKEVEGEIFEYREMRPPIHKEIVFNLDGKSYKFTVEEIQE